ncbi:hypothetical protein CHLRE_02g116200v5 [Chlamydomonas reinhardtii]|uniref:Uncharacterized protein n=1 Tax=Chlamydomonas reinhardtii TaxID=3055 RepID=A8I2P2_CHLRE|nr:uncharacterized protein CHLRE_02g116200v5 [Chlamydomonas reinhardtii]PNW87277.1 hypothetical protein CHLRE_02g116200v5 [Chlamydomonas reinhardtii]|eukprot:XP_001699644.1 predicted protein [Chlamydomonas reinhardtii]
MDLLGDYSDSDNEEKAASPPSKRSAGDTARGSTGAGGAGTSSVPQPRNAAPEPAPVTGLFNPFAPEGSGGGSGIGSGASPSSGGKRGYGQVTGSSAGRSQPAPAKASRSGPGGATAAGPKPAFGAGMLVPPQLRHGRANVSTEDVEKLFTKGKLEAKQQQQQRGGGAAGGGSAAGGGAKS